MEGRWVAYFRALPAVTGVPYAVSTIAGNATCLLPFVALDWLGWWRGQNGAAEQPR